MKKLLLLFVASLSIMVTLAQPSGMLDETFNLKSIVTNNTYYTPNGENPDLTITNSSGDFYLEAHAIENTLASEYVAFNGNSLTIERSIITLADCLVENCYYENLYFYDILTSIYNNSKTFTYYYNESNGYKYLRLKDANNNWAYFSTEPAPEPDPLLFQTWYLYRVDEDMGNPTFYDGPNPPQITINPDFSYTGVEDCSLISGDFILGGEDEYDFILQAQNYFQDASNCPPGPVGYALIDLHDNEIINCSINTDNQGIDYLTYSSSTVFSYSLRNVLILSTPENNLNDLKIFPNPVQNKLILQSSINNFDSVSITDVNGRILISMKNFISNEIDVSALKPGMYFLNIQSSEALPAGRQGNITKKFIKN